jgi:hypothetical protein
MTASGRRSFCIALSALAVSLVAACAGPVPIRGARPDLLAFLIDGQTRREEVLLTLGQPSGSFEKEQILTYRVGHDSEQGYYVIDTRSWDGVRYSLVVVFDDKGFLRAHKLVAVR